MYWRRPSWGRSIFPEYDLFRRSMDELLNGYEGRTPAAYPAVNMWSCKDKVMVTAELPGLSSDELEVTVHENTLTLRGKPATDTEERNYHRRERGQREWERTLELPCAVDPDKVEARLEKGILAVALGRAEADKPHRISITSA